MTIWNDKWIYYSSYKCKQENYDAHYIIIETIYYIICIELN